MMSLCSVIGHFTSSFTELWRLAGQRLIGRLVGWLVVWLVGWVNMFSYSILIQSDNFHMIHQVLLQGRIPTRWNVFSYQSLPLRLSINELTQWALCSGGFRPGGSGSALLLLQQRERSYSSRFMMETQKLLGCRTVPVNGPAMCLRDETDEAATDCVVI